MRKLLVVGILAMGWLVVPATAQPVTSDRLSGAGARSFIRQALTVFDEPIRIDRCDRRTPYRVKCSVTLTRSRCIARVTVHVSPHFGIVGIRGVTCRQR